MPASSSRTLTSLVPGATLARLGSLLLSSLAIAGCPPDSPAITESSGPTGSSSDATSSQTEPPTSSTNPIPVVCSDGMVSPDEACDDGNSDPDDGCDGDCQRTGVVEWTYTYDGAASFDDWAAGVAVDPAGRIIVVGMEANVQDSLDWLIIALDFSGKLLWKRTIDADTGLLDYFNDVVVDDGGRIYAAGYQQTLPDNTRASIIRSFFPDGSDRWTFREPPPATGDYTIVAALASDGDALYSAGGEALLNDNMQLVVRRHDLATGKAVWKWTDGPGTFGQSIALSGKKVVVVGQAFTQQWSPVIQVYDLMGNRVSNVVDDRRGSWIDVSATEKAGEVLVAGEIRSADGTNWDGEVRRITLSGEDIWSYHFDHDGLFDDAQAVALGPSGEVYFTGRISGPPDYQNMFMGRLGADGTPIWTSTYGDPSALLDDASFEVATGPGFMVVVGFEGTVEQQSNAWVRRYKAG